MGIKSRFHPWNGKKEADYLYQTFQKLTNDIYSEAHEEGAINRGKFSRFAGIFPAGSIDIIGN